MNRKSKTTTVSFRLPSDHKPPSSYLRSDLAHQNFFNKPQKGQLRHQNMPEKKLSTKRTINRS
jgi:hypothetical protein